MVRNEIDQAARFRLDDSFPSSVITWPTIGDGRLENTIFLRMIATMSNETWVGLSSVLIELCFRIANGFGSVANFPSNK